MKKVLFLSNCRNRGLSALAMLAVLLQPSLATDLRSNEGQSSKTLAGQEQSRPLTLEQRTQVTYDAYILGPGDGLQIDVIGLSELGGTFPIGPDGTLYLPRLRPLYVEGLTVEELRQFLTQQFSTFVQDPKLYIRPVAYRPVRVYVGGEVQRPGRYTLSGNGKLSRLSTAAENTRLRSETVVSSVRPGLVELPGGAKGGSGDLSTFGAIFPTVFDAIRSAQGITPYTDLGQVQVIRKRAERLGGGRIKTNLNLLSLITEGDESQNIRLFDGDFLYIGKSPVVLRDQLLKAGQSNLSPQFMGVFVTGRVNLPGEVKLPQGSSLNQAISLAGGTKLVRGKIEFVRFNREGTIDRRIFAYKPGAALDAPNNPILANGDLIRVQDSILSASVEVLNEVTVPFIGIYSFYSLFKGVTQ